MAAVIAKASLPRSLGRYEVVGFLAAGGMAEILLGRLVGPRGFERPVVIKRMHAHLARESRFCDVLADEARLIARIRHPNVVQVFELGREGGELFLVMEYLEGESLGGLMRRTFAQQVDFPFALAAHVIAETAGGLHAAHELCRPDGQLEGLVHRDVTPQNVFVTYDGGVKLLDFGIAKAIDRSTRTETGTLKGKYNYMSPEQCQGKPLDRRSDVFALGIVLYELTTRCRLFKRASELLTFQAICRESILPPSHLVPGYPSGLEAVVMRALQKEASARYADAAAMRRDLLGVVHELGEREPRERLSDLMKALFVDRVREKAEMLRRVQSGADIEALPAAEADESIDLPALTQAATQLSVTSGLHARRGGRLIVPLLAVALLAAGGFVWLRHRSRVLAEQATVAPASSVAAPAEPVKERVKIELESTPAGAEVLLSENSQGKTPLALDVARSGEPISIELRLEGYAPLTRKLTPDIDQRLVLSLEKKKAVPAARPAAKKTKPGAPEDFTRFE